MNVKLREQVLSMYDSGECSEEVLKLYAISGPLPNANTYSRMTEQEQQLFWENRVKDNLGDNWKDRIGMNANLIYVKVSQKLNWAKEGF